MEWIHLLPQLESAGLLSKGVIQAVRDTQNRFGGVIAEVMDHLPVISQGKSVAELVKGNPVKAVQIQKSFVKTPLALRHLVPLITNLVKSQQTKSLSDLKFEAGDVIFCPFPGAKGIFCQHVMLATSSTTVAHCVQVASDLAVLREEPWNKVLKHFGFKKGFVNKEFCKSLFQNRVNRTLRYPGMSGVRRAKADIKRLLGKSFHYDILFCNCEHWVSRWVSGEALSDQAYLLGNAGKTGPKAPI